MISPSPHDDGFLTAWYSARRLMAAEWAPAILLALLDGPLHYKTFSRPSERSRQRTGGPNGDLQPSMRNQGLLDCGQHPHPGCQLAAGTGGRNTSSSGSGSGMSMSTGGGSGGSGPAEFNCLTLIRYIPLSGPLRPPTGSKASGGAWYVSACAGFHLGMPGGGVYYPPIWVRHGRVMPPPPAPAVLARRAENALTLAKPSPVLSPVGRQLVNLPTWLWLARGGWTTRSATASVPGESVSATATPRSVSWSMGDGATVTCHGPGTAYSATTNPKSRSPDCGYTYRRSSAGAPGAAFTLTTTVRWSVAWAGTGQHGTFGGLTTTATVRVSVAESQALTTH